MASISVCCPYKKYREHCVLHTEPVQSENPPSHDNIRYHYTIPTISVSTLWEYFIRRGTGNENIELLILCSIFSAASLEYFAQIIMLEHRTKVESVQYKLYWRTKRVFTRLELPKKPIPTIETKQKSSWSKKRRGIWHWQRIPNKMRKKFSMA